MRIRTIVAVATVLMIAAALAAFLFLNGYLRFNYPNRSLYPIRGIDVSHHQGEIDWESVSIDDVSFAYMKATEGMDHRDSRFEQNWNAARGTPVAYGAYHFFTFCTPGEQQAHNFIEVVPIVPGTLPPAVDVEFAGNCKNWTSIEDIRHELQIFLDCIETAFGRQPIIYVNAGAYDRIVAGHFPRHRLWVRDIFLRPRLQRTDRWLIWQFANRGRVAGIDGLVDLNVYAGSRSNFADLLESQD